MKFQGDIASIPVTDVVQNLSTNRKSGILTIRRGGGERQMLFDDGRIVAYGDNAGFSVPGWFEDKGLIESDIYSKALKRYKKTKRKSFGEIVSDLGGMSTDVYLGRVSDIVQEMLYETFSFRDGIFEFHETSVDVETFDREQAAAGLSFSVRSVMMEAARRMDDWEAIRRSLPSENDIFQIAPTEMRALEEEFAENEVVLTALDLLDGTRSIREVIAAIPAGRFTASRVVADLVSRKVARPVDGDELVKQLDESRNSEENARALVRLKAALEREPGNQSLLLKVAELSVAEGKKEESAVYYKLLAQSLFDEGSLMEAEKELKRSLELNPNDITTWQKLYDVTEQQEDVKALYKVGMEMVGHLRRIGLNELARDHLLRMLKKFPGEENLNLRLEHAETLFALGDRAEAVKRLLDLAKDLFQAGKSDHAELTLARVIEFDPNHRRAREIYDKVRTGKLERERRRRRTIVRGTLAALLAAALGLYVGYDFFVRWEYSRVTREVFAEGLASPEDYERARAKIRSVRDRHPFSLLRFFEGAEPLDTTTAPEGDGSPDAGGDSK